MVTRTGAITAFAAMGAAAVAFLTATPCVYAFVPPSPGTTHLAFPRVAERAHALSAVSSFRANARVSMGGAAARLEMGLFSSSSPESRTSGVKRRSLGWGGKKAARRSILGGLGRPKQRGFTFLRRAAARDEEEEDDDDEGEEDDGMYEYDDGEEEYDDALDRNVAKRLKRSAVIFRQLEISSVRSYLISHEEPKTLATHYYRTLFITKDCKVSWLSWWSQTILSTVAFIILLFSNAVTNRSARGNILGNGVALALASLVTSAASICWTWGYTLKARGWPRLGTLTEVDDAQLRMRNSLKMGLYINVAGMLLALIGAEQIVGTLVAKVLYAQGFQPSVMVGSSGAAEVAQAQFRALDVFIVQANTNTLLSHFCSLAASLWLLARTPKLAKLAKGVY